MTPQWRQARGLDPPSSPRVPQSWGVIGHMGGCHLYPTPRGTSVWGRGATASVSEGGSERANR
ncbi:rCG33577 [Rattus norvegicus]|uniref:RCG33577 n=1 Tax=Rattus norvegicus TaxID=10116 RepID=A6HHH7_RAT|nr:rCG33577 [Rattus norvegicus]